MGSIALWAACGSHCVRGRGGEKNSSPHPAFRAFRGLLRGTCERSWTVFFGQILGACRKSVGAPLGVYRKESTL
eukprot:7104174-Pyramimonas_sp.AAC.1